MKPIQMVDLSGQHAAIKEEINAAIQQVLSASTFIQGPQVKAFEQQLADFLSVGQVVSCANGTDALQIALMALDLPPKSEVIVPSFGYVAAAEAVKLLGHVPVFAEAEPLTFTIDASKLEALITENTKAIIPIHLFGQCCHMLPILKITQKYNLYVIEDNAQAIGAEYTYPDGSVKKAGIMGHVGITSFFPTKNLACMGDGGAVFTNDTDLARKMRQIAQHGQSKKYIHQTVGINSRLDTLQAAILSVKLQYLNDYNAKRITAANIYNRYLSAFSDIELPYQATYTTHVFHQYCIKVPFWKRESLIAFLAEQGIPTMVYYPLPLHKQPAYVSNVNLPVAEDLCKSVLALPMHTELTEEQIAFIAEKTGEFLAK